MSELDRVEPDQYVDLEIRIFPRRGEGYPVEITLGGQQRFKRGYLPADVLPWAPTGDLGADGQRLFDILFADSALQNAWAEARGRAPRRRVRLWIDVDAAELHALPWELLRDGPVMLSARADTPFSRYLPVALPWSGPVAERPVRVLVVISNPDDLETHYDLTPVDVSLEQETLRSVFATIAPDELQADFFEAPVTPGRLEEQLRQGYHALHFLGHGAFSARRGQGALYIQDEDGNARRLLDDELVSMLAGQRVQPRMIFLAACQSATRSSADAFLGLGPKLVSAGVPVVVAMQDIVTVETARNFSAKFYRRLLEHGLVDLATNEARNTLLFAGRPDAAVPVLFMRYQDGLLFIPQKPKPTARPSVSLPIDPAQVNLIQLRKAMVETFSKSELVTLCNDLAFEYDDRSVEFDSLRGETLPTKVLDLIDWHRRRDRIADLVRKVLAERPDLVNELV